MFSTNCDLLNNYSYAQQERLAYIDFCLQYFGQIARSDLIEHFNLGQASGTRDFSLYKKLAVDNLVLKHETKHYYRTAQFKSLFQYESEMVLTHLSRGFGQRNLSNVVSSPYCFNAIKLMHPKADIIAALMRAIHQQKAIKCVYVSLSSGEIERELIPHAMVNNGYRWHIRAFDRRTAQFRDFVCTRFISIHLLEDRVISQEKASCDSQWNNIITLTLIPHPKLTYPQAIELDYAMVDGRLQLPIREALLGYMMTQWHVDCSADYSLNPQHYPLALASSAELALIHNLTLLPGANHE